LFISKLLDDYKIIMGDHSSLMKIFFLQNLNQWWLNICCLLRKDNKPSLTILMHHPNHVLQL